MSQGNPVTHGSFDFSNLTRRELVSLLGGDNSESAARALFCGEPVEEELVEIIKTNNVSSKTKLDAVRKLEQSSPSRQALRAVAFLGSHPRVIDAAKEILLGCDELSEADLLACILANPPGTRYLRRRAVERLAREDVSNDTLVSVAIIEEDDYLLEVVAEQLFAREPSQADLLLILMRADLSRRTRSWNYFIESAAMWRLREVSKFTEEISKRRESLTARVIVSLGSYV